jgi:hypothetical protein
LPEELSPEGLVKRLLDQPHADAETLLLLLSAGSLLGIVSLLGRNWRLSQPPDGKEAEQAAGRPEARTAVVDFRPSSASGRREDRKKGEAPVVRWGRRAADVEASCPAGEGIGEGGGVS